MAEVVLKVMQLEVMLPAPSGRFFRQEGLSSTSQGGSQDLGLP